MKETKESSIKIEDVKLHLEEDNVVSTPRCDIESFNTGAKHEYGSKVRKRLPFEKHGLSNKKFAPPVSSSVIDSSNEDDIDGLKGQSENSQSYNQIPKIDNLSDPVLKSNIERTNVENNSEDEIDGFTSGRRKRCSNIVRSDDEASDEYDDNAPISTLLKKDYKNKDKEDVRRQPLKRLRKLKDKNKNDDITFSPNKSANSSSDNEDNEDDDYITIVLNKTAYRKSDDEDNEDDDESLGDSIAGSSENESENKSENESENKSGSECEDESGDESEIGLNEYKETLDKIGRKKVPNSKWDLEGEMLADFGKDPEFCMRAVCALYRQQTEDEKDCKVTIHLNAHGFSQIDAARGSKLAEFLTDGSPDGDLNKTVEELEKYDANGIELSMALATKYSKQLFEIYNNKEDPFFLPERKDV